MSVNAALASLVLRLVLATVFLFHVLPKLSGGAGYGTHWQGDDPKAMAAPLQAAVAWGEAAGGIAMVIGFLPRLAAAGLAMIMAGAIATVHGKNGFSFLNLGWEYNFALIGICLAVILLGGGPYSLGRCCGQRVSQL